MLAAIDQLTKGTMSVMHQVALLQSEVSSLRKANEALSKRRRAKKHACSLEDRLRYKMQKINWARRPRLGRWRKKRSRMVVV